MEINPEVIITKKGQYEFDLSIKCTGLSDRNLLILEDVFNEFVSTRRKQSPHKTEEERKANMFYWAIAPSLEFRDEIRKAISQVEMPMPRIFSDETIEESTQRIFKSPKS